MKKLFILVTAILLVSCSEERVEGVTECSCVNVMEWSSDTTNYTVWHTYQINPSDYPCSQNGYTQYISTVTSQTGALVINRFRVECE